MIIWSWQICADGPAWEDVASHPSYLDSYYENDYLFQVV